MNSGTKIVFLGSGPVGLASLKSLQKTFVIEAVITKPDPKSSRAPRLVAEYAEEQGLNLLQPASKQELSEMVADANFTSRLGVVVDYGVIIPKDVIDSFELGIVNSHFALLPEWRGADPITFSILSGQEVTGVSLMLIVPKLDEGELLLQRKVAIESDETTESLTEKLIELSNTMLEEALPVYVDGNIHPFPQDNPQLATYSRKLTKADGVIDWNKSAAQLEREIRAYKGWPGSKTEIAGKTVTITEAAVSEESGEVGTFISQDKQIVAYCGEGSLVISRLKPDGRGEMTAEAFLAGNPLSQP